MLKETQMRTTLVLDEQLLEEVRVLSGARTKKAAVEAAMRDFVRRRKARKLLALEGNVELAETVDDLIKRRRKDVPGR
jgi:Arc/MetJ family transcription regulator